MTARQVQPHADDLGLHPSIDRAIFRAYEAGALSGASILVGGPTFVAAAAEAQLVGMPVWLHLALVDSDPVSPAAEIPTLVGPDGRFPRTFPIVAARGLLGRLSSRDLAFEIMRQIERFTDAGLADDEGVRLDGHQHLHVLPAVVNAILNLAPVFRIRAVRRPAISPAESGWLSARPWLFRGLGLVARVAARRFRARGIRSVPCWGTVCAGHLDLQRARAILRSLPDRASGQLLCHPGDDNRALGAVYPWSYDWEGDLATVLSLTQKH